MKTVILIVFVAWMSPVQAQSLKDALYSGRLKSDTGAVVKKGDSLKLREKPAPPAVAAKDSSKKNNTDTTAASVKEEVQSAPANNPAPAPNVTADNNRVWKKFVDEYTPIIKAEVLPSKKIKNGTYSVLIEYEIGVDGSVSTVDISSSPESSYLVEQIKTRMMMNAPQLSPVLMSNGKPRKVLKKQLLTFSKEKD